MSAARLEVAQGGHRPGRRGRGGQSQGAAAFGTGFCQPVRRRVRPGEPTLG